MQKLNGKKGFTLLELLVVISIIGILVAIGAVAYSQAQQKGRDAKRVGDMKALQSAFEQYYSTHNNVYSDSCLTMATAASMALPTDPKSGWTAYNTSSGCTSTSAYCICADLEGTSGNASNSNCSSFVSGGGGFYCVTNLQ